MTTTLVRRLWFAVLVLALSGAAHATYHLFRITQLYSNADGSVQYIMLTATAGGQEFISGKNIKSTQGSVTHTYTFATDLPGDTAMETGDGYGYYGGGMTSYRTFLIATEGFAALGVVTPDYVVPNGFFFTGNGSVNYADSADLISYSSLPTDGVTAMNRGGSTAVNTPMNFNGASASLSNATFASYEGLWLKGDEAGWGINLTHQGSTLFATWFTYDTDGGGMWLVMSNGARTGPGSYTGTLYRTTGPSFSAANFGSLAASNYTQVGTLTLTFTDANNGTMSYTVNGVTQTKPIVRFFFATPPTCMLGQAAGSSPNYQDLWWRSPANSESGWGVNITHQADILFATWFTYQAGSGTTNKGLWLVMSNGVKTANGVFTGDLQTTTGPAFSATPFDSSKVVRTTVGSATFTFTDANNGTFSYTVNGVTQTKPITRLTYSSPATICR